MTTRADDRTASRVDVHGTVRGVGFRPYVVVRALADTVVREFG